MRILALTTAFVFALSAAAQFNTIGRVTSRTGTTNASTDASADTVNHKNNIDTIPGINPDSNRQAAQRLVIHPPLPGKLHVSSPYGKRSNPFGLPTSEFHHGLDLSAKAGTPIYSMLPGTVDAVDYDNRSGNYIKLRHGNFTVAYCHLIRKPSVPVGLHIPAGFPIGFVGSTGRSTAPHRHITFKRNGQVIDPAILLTLMKGTTD